MTAASLLGVAINAGRDEVQAAFRQRARAAHPDMAHGTQGSGADLDVLTQARDTLLAPAPKPRVPISPSPAARRSAQPGSQPTSGSGPLAWVLRFLGIVVVGAVVAIVIVLIWALVAGTERTADSDLVVDECLIVTPSDVTEASCDEFGAQRIVEQLSGARDCGAGANTLVVDSTTYCLVPSDS